MEGRSIPHLRDIFGVEADGCHGQEPKEDVGNYQAQVAEDRGRSRPSKRNEEAKHLERHLSMKKTIRKKIMRELQQAFVEDPEEFTGVVEEKGGLNISFGKGGNFLDFLRTGEAEPSRESRQDSGQEKQQGFWRRFTFRRNKR